MSHIFDPKMVAKLENPERLKFQNPALLSDILELSPGKLLGEVGIGSGFFARNLLKANPDIHVLGADISEEMLTYLREHIDSKDLLKIKCYTMTPDTIPFDDESVDALLLANLYHELSDTTSFLQECYRVLRKGAPLVIVDWKKIETPMGPPLSERFSEFEILTKMEFSGFERNSSFEIYDMHSVIRGYK